MVGTWVRISVTLCDPDFFFFISHALLWRTTMSWVYEVRLQGQRRKGAAEPFSRWNRRQAQNKEGGLLKQQQEEKIYVDFSAVWPRLMAPRIYREVRMVWQHEHINVEKNVLLRYRLGHGKGTIARNDKNRHLHIFVWKRFPHSDGGERVQYSV